MTPRERVEKTLKRERTDRVASDLWATGELIAAALAETGSPDEAALWDLLGIDKIVGIRAPYLDLEPTPPGYSGRSEWGVLYRKQSFDGGVYGERASTPLSGAESVADMERYRWPDPARFDYAALRGQAEAAAGRAVMLNFITLFEVYVPLRGYETALTDLYVEKEIAAYGLGRIASIQMDYIARALDAAGDSIDLVYFSDDMGMQDRQLFGTEIWDEMIGPHAQRIIDLVHSRGKKVFYHTDGSAPGIVDRLVGMGIDILNPIQHVCPGMERERLKKLYGKKLVFHGAVENQKVLPFGTPAEVRQETLDCIRILGEGGGYIVAPCHNIQPNTPIANVRAMYDAVREAGDRFM